MPYQLAALWSLLGVSCGYWTSLPWLERRMTLAGMPFIGVPFRIVLGYARVIWLAAPVMA